MNKPLQSFSTPEECIRAVAEQLAESGEECIDNTRFAFVNNEAMMEKYERIRDGGCCGYHDESVIVNGREAQVGFNYGH